MAGRLNHWPSGWPAPQAPLSRNPKGAAPPLWPRFAVRPCAKGLGAGGTPPGPRVLPHRSPGWRLKDVPIAIETLGEAALAAGPVTDITAIQLVSPAVSGSGNSSAQPLIAVRGIVSNDFSIGADPALGIYVDDVYTGRSAGAVQELVDIDRVEIVKGPQGTLFGRNTTAGAISLYTNRPDLGGFSGSAVTSIGDFDAVHASTTVNLPLDDQTAVRASMVYDRHDGFFENTVGGRRLDKADHLAGRAALRFQSGALDVILTGEY